MVLIALTGISGVGKSHISGVLSRLCDYDVFSFSSRLKSIFKKSDPWKKDYLTYKHYLCSKAEKINCMYPDIFINTLLEELDMYAVNCSVIDDLRSPRQYRALSNYCENKGIEMFVIRVVSDTGKVVSFMDEFELPVDGVIENNQLTDSQILQQISKIIMSRGI